MNAYSPPIYQKRATQRERHEDEVAELMRFAFWLFAFIETENPDELDWEQAQALVEEFIASDKERWHV